MISTAQNISKIIHPRLNFMHFIISNTKVSSFVLELCTSLPRNRMCVCVCVRAWCGVVWC